MSVFAAVMTGRGTGAISTIELFGDSAPLVLKRIFKPAGQKPSAFEPGTIRLGTICNGSETIDQVIIGCKSADNFAINCHGNPLIVEMIMELLGRYGVTAISGERLTAEILTTRTTLNTIAIEAKLAIPKARTLAGTKIITNQIDNGLTRTVQNWLTDPAQSPDRLRNQALQILQATEAAKLIIFGCTICLAGPVNTGKSTLLNCLCGRQKSIVTDIKGTTRDYVTGQCTIGRLCAELIDTAGLDEQLESDTIDRLARQKTAELIDRTDLVILVLDNSQPREQLNEVIVEKLDRRKVLPVLNKSDLPAAFDSGKLPRHFSAAVSVSAKYGTGIDRLKEQIEQALGATSFDLKQPVCFTNRQRQLLQQLASTEPQTQPAKIITELLNGPVSV